MTRALRGLSSMYATGFTITENPISEAGNWKNGAADGVDWTDNRTSGNKQFGTQTGNNTNTGIGVTPSQYDDSVSHLGGVWAADHGAKATVFSTVASANYDTEVELLVRFSITAHTARGYEVEFSANPGNGYFDIVRWNGTVADFTPLLHLNPGQTASGSSIASRAVVAGDVLEATVIGSTISAYVNGAFLASATDTTWTNGAPGVGHYLHNLTASGDVTSYGFSSYTARSLLNRSAANSRTTAATRTIVA